MGCNSSHDATYRSTEGLMPREDGKSNVATQRRASMKSPQLDGANPSGDVHLLNDSALFSDSSRSSILSREASRPLFEDGNPPQISIRNAIVRFDFDVRSSESSGSGVGESSRRRNLQRTTTIIDASKSMVHRPQANLAVANPTA